MKTFRWHDWKQNYEVFLSFLQLTNTVCVHLGLKWFFMFAKKNFFGLNLVICIVFFGDNDVDVIKWSTKPLRLTVVHHFSHTPNHFHFLSFILLQHLNISIDRHLISARFFSFMAAVNLQSNRHFSFLLQFFLFYCRFFFHCDVGNCHVLVCEMWTLWTLWTSDFTRISVYLNF